MADKDVSQQSSADKNSIHPFYSILSSEFTPQNNETDLKEHKNGMIGHQRGSHSRSRSRSNRRDHKDHRKGRQDSDSEQPEGNSKNMGQNHQKDKSYFKTKICPLFKDNACKKGMDCTYAHGEKELRFLPNFRKTRLCIAFKKGQCLKSKEDCRYAHGEEDIRQLTHDYQKSTNLGKDRERRDRRDRRDKRDRYGRNDRYPSRRERRHGSPREHQGRKRHYHERSGSRDHYRKQTHPQQNFVPGNPWNHYLPNYNEGYMIPGVSHMISGVNHMAPAHNLHPGIEENGYPVQFLPHYAPRGPPNNSGSMYEGRYGGYYGPYSSMGPKN